MRRFFALLFLVLLASCIDVEDFGAYWDKGVIDPDLAGPWVMLTPDSDDAKHDFTHGQMWRFIEKNGAFEVHVHIDGKPDKAPIYPVRSLVIGGNAFMMAGEKQGESFSGNMLRYDVVDGMLTVYSLRTEKMMEFLRKNYPDVKNIKIGTKKNIMTIQHFDDAVFDILSRIPDDETFWQPEMKLEQFGN